jgi:type I restriction enzyme S subunit
MMDMAALRTIRIGDLGRVVTGKTPPSARPELFGENFPFLTPTDMDGQQRYIKPERFLSAEGRNFQSRLLLPEKSVCVVCIGATIGKVCMTSQPSFTNQQINTVIVNEAEHDSFFIYHLLTTLREELKANAGGAATPIINKTAFSEIEVSVPSLPTQRRIASILSAYDELIENNQRRIRILEDMARSLYREWFVHFRYPGFESVLLVASPLGQIPQGWEVKKLGEIATVNRAQINIKAAPNELHYIDIASVSPGQIDNITTYSFSDAPGRARRIVQHGDILWSCVRPNRRSHALVMQPEPDTIASTGFAVLTATDVPFTFLYFATTTDDFVAFLTNSATGSAYPAVSAKTFENAELLVPSKSLLTKFCDITVPMAEQIHALQRQTTNLRRTRDLLLPRLLTGSLKLECDEEGFS